MKWLGILLASGALLVALVPAQTQLRVERQFELMRGYTTALAWSPRGDLIAKVREILESQG